MAVTTVQVTCGTSSRAYSTLQAAEDDKPTNLTTNRSSTTQSGSTSSTIKLDSGASATTDFYKGHAVYCTARPTEKRLITAYNGTTKVATIGALNGSSATWANTPGTEAYAIDETIWEIDCYNDSQFTAGCLISGSTTSSSSYCHLTCATGQSYYDNASVRTNLLVYNQSNGVGCSITGTYISGAVALSENNAHVSRMQLKTAAASSFSLSMTGSATGLVVKDCLIQGITDSSINGIGTCDSGTGNVINVLAIHTGATGNGWRCGANVAFIACGAVRTTNNAASGSAYKLGPYATGSTLLSSTAFGFSDIDGGTNHFTTSGSGNNATQLASGLPGSNNQHSVTYNGTTPFTQAGSSGTDFRSIASTSLAANGSLDSTNAPLDMSGYTRANPPTIGPWEITASAAATVRMLALLGVGT